MLGFKTGTRRGARFVFEPIPTALGTRSVPDRSLNRQSPGNGSTPLDGSEQAMIDPTLLEFTC